MESIEKIILKCQDEITINTINIEYFNQKNKELQIIIDDINKLKENLLTNNIK